MGPTPCPLFVMCLLATAAGIGFDYAEARSKAVTACEAIDPSQSESGLIFNPDGYRSYYVTYIVRATVALDVGSGGPSGYWSPTFIEGVFPARERSQSLTRHATF